MSRYTRSASLAVACLLACTSSLVQGQIASLNTTTLSFGNQAVSTTSAGKTVQLKNTSTTALLISNIALTNAVAPFTVASTCPPLLAFNTSCTITATFSPTTTGAASGSISITDNAANTPQTINLTGTGVVQASLSGSTLSFGSVAVGASGTSTLTFKNNLNTPLAITATGTGDFAVTTAKSTPCGASVAAGAQCSIGVTFTPTLLGSRSGTLTVTDSANNNPQTASLSGTGVVQASLSASSVSFGNVGLGVGSTSTVTLKNNLNTALAITIAITGSGDFAATTAKSTPCGTSLAALAQCSIAITFTPSQLIARTGTLTVTDTASNSPQTAALSGTGTTSSISSISVNPGNPEILLKGTQQFSANGAFPSGINMDVTNFVTWSSSSTSVAAVTSTGLATGKAAGTTSIKATLSSKSGSTSLAVVIPVTPTITWPTPAPITYGTPLSSTQLNAAATVNGVSVPGTYVYLPSAGLVLHAANEYLAVQFLPTDTIRYNNASTNVVLVVNKATATVNLGNLSVTYDGTAKSATVTTNPPGLTYVVYYNGDTIWPVSVGNYSVLATVNTLNYQGSITGSFTIAPAALVSIAVSPTNPAIPLGGTKQFTAIGTYTDRSTKDLTSTATWTSSITTAATVSAGLATAASSGCGGPTTITATSGSVSGSAGLMVSVPGGFACGANTLDARDPHTATLLDNGLILIAGGLGSTGSSLSTAELYDPVANTSHYTSTPMTTARAYHTATLLDDGTVLFVGGTDAGANPLATAEIYDPGSDKFTSTGSLANARQSHTATLLSDGTVAIIGGSGASGDVAAIELFDPVAGTFSSPSSLLTARDGHTATLLSNGNVFIAGGNAAGTATNSAELFATVGYAVTASSGTMVSNRALQTATPLSNGLILIAGGVDQSGNPINLAELYDPTLDSFTSTGSMTCARASHTATALSNGTVLFAGGCATLSTSAEIYDPAGAGFTAPFALNALRGAPTATLEHCNCPEDGWALIADGNDMAGHSLNTTEWYQPAALSAAGLTGVQVSPGTATIAWGTTAQFTAMGIFGSDPQQPLGAVSWTSSNPLIVTISNDATNSGMALPVNAGTVTISGCAGAICGTASLTVLAP